jgi:hypothetical protein
MKLAPSSARFYTNRWDLTEVRARGSTHVPAVDSAKRCELPSHSGEREGTRYASRPVA